MLLLFERSQSLMNRTLSMKVSSVIEERETRDERWEREREEVIGEKKRGEGRANEKGVHLYTVFSARANYRGDKEMEDFMLTLLHVKYDFTGMSYHLFIQKFNHLIHQLNVYKIDTCVIHIYIQLILFFFFHFYLGDGPIQEGDPIVDTSLFELNGSPTKLSNFIVSKDRPLVVFAGKPSLLLPSLCPLPSLLLLSLRSSSSSSFFPKFIIIFILFCVIYFASACG